MTTLAAARTVISGFDVVVIGYNPENADIVNRRGEIYGASAYVQVEAPDGSRWTLRHRWVGFEYEVVPRGEAFAKRVQARLDAGGALDPAQWAADRPGYGSEAYASGGWTEIDFAEERARDLDDERWGAH